MKAVILAAGKGIRMLPLTKDKPKILIEINGKPFLYYLLENLKKAGITELGIVVGYKKEKIAEYIRTHKLKITLITQPEAKGTGDALRQAKSFCDRDDFIVMNGDNLYSVEDLKAVQQKDRFCYVIGKEVEDWQKYGVLVISKDHHLVKIVEKPIDFVGKMINVGLYKCTYDIWPAVENLGLSLRGEYELTDAICLLAQEHKVKVLRLHDYWLDLGCLEDILKIEEFLKTRGENKDGIIHYGK
ncbi:NTP transferase domain-containing protein [Candidatus Woesearchaeota archaeon]|nr:NTP transferase domain-containing protein [Candidatus Woesearchaeota archaeon]